MPVRIYQFASEIRTGLNAFAGDLAGSKLPERHGPWTATGNIRPNQALPHRLDRTKVEASIDTLGYQMWRLKKQSD
jgi:hypothetical protein